MPQIRHVAILGVVTLLGVLTRPSANAQVVKTVFVIATENYNWTQPANQFSGPIQQIFQNPSAPFINSLVNGTAVARHPWQAGEHQRAGGFTGRKCGI